MEIEDVVTLNKGKVANIGVTNDKDRSVNLKITVSKQVAMCEPAFLNTLLTKQIMDKGKDEDGITYHCLEFLLYKVAPLEVTVMLDNDIYSNHSI